MNIVAKNVTRFRKKIGWTMAELSRRSGLSSVRMIESGQRPNIRYATVTALASALGVSVSDLYSAGE